MTVTMNAVRSLAIMQPDNPVLSMHLRTDPRDPANTAVTPGWLVALRNGLREASGDTQPWSRDQQLDLRDLFGRVAEDILALPPSERARGLSWFRTADGSLDRRIALQLPPRDHVVVLDQRPFVSPLVDVADRGRPAGVVLIGGDAVRLLHWETGRISEPDQSLYELELGNWRDHPGYAVRHPTRQHEAHEQRLDERRQRFLREAAAAAAAKVAGLGWQRLLLIGEPGVADRFEQELPEPARERVIARDPVNLLWAEPDAIASRIEDDLDAVWRRDGHTLVEDVIEATHAGGPGAVGWHEVLDALVQQRVEHLIFAPGSAPDPDHLAPYVRLALGHPPRHLLAERALELAVSAGTEVTSLPESDAGPLEPVGGVAAALRY